MANPERGEVNVSIGGTDYILRFSTNAICSLEARTGERAIPFLNRFASQDVGVADLRVIVWAGLLDRHPDVTLEAAGDLIDVARRDSVSLTESAMEAFGLALAEVTGNPPAPAPSRRAKKKTTAGRRSSTRPSQPVSTQNASGG